MSLFQIALIVLGSLIIPLLSYSYIRFRVEARRQQLIGLFSRDGILEVYLQGKRQDLRRTESETEEAHRQRVRAKFDQVFENEFGQEYSKWYYTVTCMAGSLFSSAVILVLVTEGLGEGLMDVPISAPVRFALLGGFFWSIWYLVRSYAATDLAPVAFYWMIFRYVLAVCIGLLTPMLFVDAIASLGSFVLASLPITETMRFVRGRFAQNFGGSATAERQTSLEALQGIDREIMDKLTEVGITTIQGLAYVDPLALLFRTNFPPKVVIDWMDQALLYCYVGDAACALRVRGIRGATELALLQDSQEQDLLTAVAACVKISVPELSNLAGNFYFDNQVRLVWEIWGGFEEAGRPLPEKPGSPAQEAATISVP